MRTATFEPIDLNCLGELTVGVVAAAADDRQAEVGDLLHRIDAAGGSFAVSWALALAAARADVRCLEPDDGGEPPLVVAGAAALAEAVLSRAATGQVFDASARFLGSSPEVRSTTLSVLVSVAAGLRAVAA